MRLNYNITLIPHVSNNAVKYVYTCASAFIKDVIRKLHTSGQNIVQIVAKWRRTVSSRFKSMPVAQTCKKCVLYVYIFFCVRFLKNHYDVFAADSPEKILMNVM